MLCALFVLIKTIILIGTKIIDWFQSLRRVLLLERVHGILEAIISPHGKEVVLEVPSLLVNVIKEGKAKRMKFSVPKAARREVRFIAHVGKEEYSHYNKKEHWRRNCSECLIGLKDGTRGEEIYLCETCFSIRVHLD